MTYFAYLDEFGHIGPYVSRTDPRHNDNPVFGLEGFVLPAKEVRGFGTWFFQRKCEILEFEIRRNQAHPGRTGESNGVLGRARGVAVNSGAGWIAGCEGPRRGYDRGG